MNKRNHIESSAIYFQFVDPFCFLAYFSIMEIIICHNGLQDYQVIFVCFLELCFIEIVGNRKLFLIALQPRPLVGFFVYNSKSSISTVSSGAQCCSVVLTDTCPGQPGYFICKDDDVKIWNVQHCEIVRRYPTLPSRLLGTTLEILFSLIVVLSFLLYVLTIFGI